MNFAPVRPLSRKQKLKNRAQQKALRLIKVLSGHITARDMRNWELEASQNPYKVIKIFEG